MSASNNVLDDRGRVVGRIVEISGNGKNYFDSHGRLVAIYNGSNTHDNINNKLAGWGDVGLMVLAKHIG
jgi:hypothetical protein